MKARTRRSNRNIIAEVLGAVVVYGGTLATRQEVYDDLREVRGPKGEQISYLMTDKLVFMCPVATPEQVEHLSRCGLTLKQVREQEGCAV